MIIEGEEWTNPKMFSMQYSYECPGPSAEGGTAAKNWDPKLKGTKMTINECLKYPNCSCEAYLHAVSILERLSA